MPLASVTGPVPRLSRFKLSASVPVFTVIPPLNVLVPAPPMVRMPVLVFVRLLVPEITPERVSVPAPVPPTVVLAAKAMLLDTVTALALLWLICGRLVTLRFNESALPLTVKAGRALPKFHWFNWKVPARSLILAVAYGVVLKLRRPLVAPPAGGATLPVQFVPVDQLPGAMLVHVINPTTLMLTVAAGESIVPSLALKVKLSEPL